MRKFLAVSVCLFASLAANAGIKVTKCADGVTDSIAVDGSFTEADLQNMKVASKVKLATGSYELTENEWAKLCEKVIAYRVYTLDMNETRFGFTLTRENFYGNLTSWGSNHVKNITLSRYADIPNGCFLNNSSIESITLPNKKGNESITIGEQAFGSMSALKTLYIGSCVTAVGKGLCECSYAGQSKLAKVTFNTPEIKELPGHCFKYISTLKDVTLPINLQVVGEEEFEDCGLETITFPITLTTIKKNAFDHCMLEYVVIPKNVTLIETEAFHRNSNLTDVYVMGTDVKCQEAAFGKEETCAYFNNVHTGFSEADAASREDWAKMDWDTDKMKNPVVLHFVAQGDQTFKNYENPYWIMLNTPGILDELKGYDTSVASQEAFIEKYGLQYANLFPWSLYKYANGLDNQPCPFAYYKYINNKGEEKVCKMWRNGDEGYYSGTNIKDAGEDYAGWRQFLIIQDDAEQNTFEDPKRVDDRWYSMCFPFNLTANQIRTAYGAGTEVCEFLGVWNTNEKDAEGKNILSFQYKSILNTDDYASLHEEEDDENFRVGSPIITYANRSYMIHPASKKEDDNTTVWYRIIPGVSKDKQVGHPENIIPTRPTFDTDIKEMEALADGGYELIPGFEFIGNYDETKKLPADSYYFAYRDHSDGSRSLILNHLTRDSKNAWTPMTALVRPYTEEVSMANFAKKLSFGFDITVNKNETTGIQEIDNNQASNKKGTDSQKVYNLNGQIVGTSLNGLSQGIYVINGKKHIVK